MRTAFFAILAFCIPGLVLVIEFGVFIFPVFWIIWEVSHSQAMTTIGGLLWAYWVHFSVFHFIWPGVMRVMHYTLGVEREMWRERHPTDGAPTRPLPNNRRK